MSIKIGSNIASMQAQRRLGEATSSLSKIYERLSSGNRINSASDDAAGLAIASQLNSRAKVFNQAIRNVNDGISLANIAEGALGAVKDISTRQLELAEQAANGTYSTKQRAAMNTESQALTNELNRIVASTAFNGRKVFDPALGGTSIQVGYGATSEVLQMDINSNLTHLVGSGTFQNAATYQDSAVGSVSVTYGDVNGDGVLDLITVGQDYSTISTFIGSGNGTFGTSTSTHLTAGNYPYEIHGGDLNGDGRVDFISTDDSGNINVLISNGNGTFQNTSNLNIGTGDALRGAVIGDFNGDGKQDILGVSSAGGGTSAAFLFIGNGNGTFQVPTSNPVSGGQVYHVVSGDFNGDGKLDFVTSDYYNNQVSVYVGSGNGTFQTPVSYQVAGLGPQGMAVGDLNSDGIMDLVTANNNNTVGVLLGNGNGTFATATSLSLPEGQPVSVIIGDFNGDGKADVAGTGYSDTVSIFFGNGNGTFNAAISIATGGNTSNWLTAADFNNDGALDLVTSNRGSSNVSVILSNSSLSINFADVDLTTQAGARSAISTLNNNLSKIQAQLGTIGATTSRFSVALANLRVQSENSLAAASRIESADIGSESAELVRRQIQQQVATSVLAQANIQPQLALRLLSS